jgi:hypothetical protein
VTVDDAAGVGAGGTVSKVIAVALNTYRRGLVVRQH